MDLEFFANLWNLQTKAIRDIQFVHCFRAFHLEHSRVRVKPDSPFSKNLNGLTAVQVSVFVGDKTSRDIEPIFFGVYWFSLDGS
jgi:hypothetical protein